MKNITKTLGLISLMALSGSAFSQNLKQKLNCLFFYETKCKVKQVGNHTLFFNRKGKLTEDIYEADYDGDGVIDRKGHTQHSYNKKGKPTKIIEETDLDNDGNIDHIYRFTQIYDKRGRKPIKVISMTEYLDNNGIVTSRIMDR